MDRLQKRKLLWAFEATAFFYLLAHGYRFVNNMFSGDSLVAVYQDDYAWQIALGRCFNPIWVFLRGTLTSPWLISVLGTFWMSLAVFCVVDFLGGSSRGAVILTASVMTINPVVACLNATFLPWTDLQIFALFLNAAGVWFLKEKGKRNFFVGFFLLMLGLGTYQAYLMVSVSLVMIRILMDLAEKRELDREGKLILRYGAGFLGAGVFYFIIWKTMQKMLNIWTADTYNGLSSLGDYTGVAFGRLAAEAYKEVFRFFWNPHVFVSLYFKGSSLEILWIWVLRLVNSAIVLMTAAVVLYQNHRNKTSVIQKVLQASLFLLLPLGMNFVYILSKGMEHTLMIFSFLTVYFLAIRLLLEPAEKNKWLMGIKYACIAGLALVCWVNMIFSNQIYLKRKLQEEASLSLLTRIVNDVENFEGYLPGRTQVALSGKMALSTEISDPAGFEDLTLYGVSNTPLFYAGTIDAYFKYYLNSAIVLTEVDPYSEEVRNMPSYPAQGSIAFVGDVLVVKIAEPN